MSGAETADSKSTEESRTGGENLAVSDSEGSRLMPWIPWFCSFPGNELLCEVDKEYIRQDFNLYGLSEKVSDYEEALAMILDVEGDEYTEEHEERINSSAENLYGLIHARYILTSDGMAKMFAKYEMYGFGSCPRKLCDVQRCLPVGENDEPGLSTVNVYCPKCEEIYYPWFFEQAHNDGAWFGTTFPHLFLMTYQQLKPESPERRRYVPKVFGFKIHKS